jgi:ubiquinone/menaquinone biosynthesis C-methylase UbiE
MVPSVKSSTDLHWNERAVTVKDDIEVNIMDIFQREIEYDYVCRHLTSEMRLLEVGCGNGFSTARFRTLVKHVDAFDYAESMVARAREKFGETNNRFLVDNVLAPSKVSGAYDAVVCIRVLINLRNLDEQRTALNTLDALTKPGGFLLLAEGFSEGFDALNELRSKIALPPIKPAPINVYSSTCELLSFFEGRYDLADEFHLGSYDYLTRVLYPLIVGPENATHNTVFREKCAKLARQCNPDCLKAYSRMRGFVFRKHS